MSILCIIERGCWVLNGWSHRVWTGTFGSVTDNNVNRRGSIPARVQSVLCAITLRPITVSSLPCNQDSRKFFVTEYSCRASIRPQQCVPAMHTYNGMSDSFISRKVKTRIARSNILLKIHLTTEERWQIVCMSRWFYCTFAGVQLYRTSLPTDKQ